MHAKFRKTDSESTQDKTLPDSSVYTFVDEPCGEDPNINSLTFDKKQLNQNMRLLTQNR